MVEVANATHRPGPGRWQFSLRGLFAFTFSVALGLSYWKMDHDWYVGGAGRGLVLDRPRTGGPDAGYLEQFHTRWPCDVRRSLGPTVRSGVAARRLFPDRRLLPASTASPIPCSCRQRRPGHRLRLFASDVRRGPARLDHRRNCRLARLCSPRLAAPWSWAVYVFRGLTAGILFLVLLEEQFCIPCLIHLIIVEVQSAQPLRYSMDVTIAASRTRVTQFYDVATAGAISVLVSCVLLWQVSVYWRRAGWPRACLGFLLAVSLAVMSLLTARIVVVEIPTISPVMADNIRVPAPLQLAAAAVLTVLLATAVARRSVGAAARGSCSRKCDLATRRRAILSHAPCPDIASGRHGLGKMHCLVVRIQPFV